LLYLGDGKITDKDLPHRTAMTKMILDEHKRELERLREELHNAVGRISYTLDLWSDQNRSSFMAVTAHYIIRTKWGIWNTDAA
ncbi:hypothetical protein BKA70DRAFT_1113001, partial [Coprinopsis sp. MPI-PUGE-AT-0042]